MVLSVFFCLLCLRSLLFAGAFAPSPASSSSSVSVSWRSVSAATGSQSSSPRRRRQRFVALTTSSNGANYNDDAVLSKSFYLSPDKIKPIITFGKGDKEKNVNAWGLWCLVASAITFPIWGAALYLLDLIHLINKKWDPLRIMYDRAGRIWAKCWLFLCRAVPSFSGDATYLKTGSGPCLYMANHASYLDIAILSYMCDPGYKFIAKSDLKNVPCIGKQLRGGQHILIDRNDRRSQLHAFKSAISWLNQGVSVMAFPEGQRSRDGRLLEFKDGLFSIATKTGVPIVPITISHAHAVMPCNSLLPFQRGNGKLHVHVHEPIATVGKSVGELVKLVREAFLSSLPYEQRPKVIQEDKTASIDVDATDVDATDVVA